MKAVALALALLAAMAAPAWPCGNPVVLSGDRAVQRVQAAERLLERGDPKGAARLMGSVWIRDEALAPRAALVRLTARMRRAYGARAHAAERSDAVADMVSEFEDLLVERPDAPAVLARLAEALAAGDAAQRSRAAAIVDDLVARDLMPDARAWRTVAQVRAAAGDADGAAAARATCRTRGGSKRVCRLDATR